MPFSHHSHSGQFCAHARNTLAEMLDAAKTRKMTVFAFTEHMPRGDEDLYPEEVSEGTDAEVLSRRFEAYVAEAKRLRDEHSSSSSSSSSSSGTTTNPHILIAFEAEWIRPPSCTRLIRSLLSSHRFFDYIIGSVHHVRTIPIDFDRELYSRARESCGGTDEGLFAEYFDAQWEMLRELKPQVVGHFDLVRLLCDVPDRGWKMGEDNGGSGGGDGHGGGDRVWAKILRNLKFVAEYGGLLEINTAAWRKGLQEPYPRSEICKAFREMGGGFVLSDDSHGVEQVATNYHRLEEWLRKVGIEELKHLWRGEDGRVEVRTMSVEEVMALPFWNAESSV